MSTKPAVAFEGMVTLAVLLPVLIIVALAVLLLLHDIALLVAV